MKRQQRWKKKKEKPRRTKTNQPGLFEGVTPGPGNGNHCQVRNEWIDTAVCTVQQVREPGKCRGCGHFGG